MASQKIVLTYKRKRLSTQGDLVPSREVNASPNSPEGILPGRLQLKTELGSYKEKNVPPNGLQYPSTGIQDSEKYPQPQVQEMKRTKRNKFTEKSEREHMKLHSQKILSSGKDDEPSKVNPSSADACVSKEVGSSMVDVSCTTAGSSLKVTLGGRSSRSPLLPDTDGIKYCPACLNSSTENTHSSGCSDSVLKTSTSDSLLLNKEPQIEKPTPPLIAFYRRVKKKRKISEVPVERNLKIHNQGLSDNGNNHGLEGSTQKIIFKDHPTTATVLEQADNNTVHMCQQDQKVNADEHMKTNSTLAAGFAETKITAGDTSGGSSLNHSEGMKLDYVEHATEKSTNRCLSTPTMKECGNPVPMHEDRQCMPDGIDTSSREEMRNNLSIAVDNSRKIVTPQIVSEDRCQINDLNVSVMPQSAACLYNESSNKPSADIMPENLIESQCSSTPSCAVVDDEVDGRGKELEWLDSLDKSLQEAKENRDKCLVRDQDDNNCGSSSGWASPLIPSKSPVQSPCTQNQYKVYKRQPDRVFLSLSSKPGDGKEEFVQKAKMSSVGSSFLDLSPPLNSKVPVGHAKDFLNQPSSSNLGPEETNGHMINEQVPWHPLCESSIVFRHKKIVEDVITSTRILKERQSSLLDKYRRYSNEWSEEELDSLWIGVRRHGIHNWNAMLRDPKLCFSELKAAEDLARRWEFEQRKLFNAPLVQPASRPIFTSVPAMDLNMLLKPASGYGTSSQAYPDFPSTAAETRLSLGDVYHQKDNNLKRSLFHNSSSTGTTNMSSSARPCTIPFFSSSMVGSDNPIPSIRHQKPTRSRNTRSLWKPFILRHNQCESPENYLAGLPTSGTLPHWLKPVSGTHLTPTESALPPLSTATQLENALNNDMHVGVPFTNLSDRSVRTKKGRQPGTLKRKGVASRNKAAALRAADVLASMNESWNDTRLGSLPSLGLALQKAASADPGPSQNMVCDLNIKVPVSDAPCELVVIDSDVSSEETVSDNQGSAH